ncbi:hypothetical protein C4588_02120 [Candidatus Parcubacteria bacterium]|nr:MAG: hypothetical protein C4588_02120 [Candidatus Parcubacteria bacterium]
MHTTKQTPNGRGCGFRDEGGTYLSLGIGPGGTLHVEDLILDPVKPWPGEWQRGFKILPNRGGWNDVGIFISKEDYPSLWDFVEEVRRYGISRKVPPTFPFESLTPGKSRMIFFHARGIPKFDFSLDPLFETPLAGCKWFPKSDGLGELSGNWELWDKTIPGYHPKSEISTVCTFSHQHLAGRIHDVGYDEHGDFIIKMPSFSYSGNLPIIAAPAGTIPKLEWDTAAFMSAPLTHVEMPKKKNPKSATRANQAGYEVVVTEW